MTNVAGPPRLESYIGHLETVHDVLLVVEACRCNLLPRVTRRLSERQRAAIRAGAVYVWRDHEAGIKRWTDGRTWSPSRVYGSFLVYRECVPRAQLAQLVAAGQTEQVKKGHRGEYCYLPQGLVKKTISVGLASGLVFHVVAYTNDEATDDQSGTALVSPTADPFFATNRIADGIPQGLYPPIESHNTLGRWPGGSAAVAAQLSAGAALQTALAGLGAVVSPAMPPAAVPTTTVVYHQANYALPPPASMPPAPVGARPAAYAAAPPLSPFAPASAPYSPAAVPSYAPVPASHASPRVSHSTVTSMMSTSVATLPHPHPAAYSNSNASSHHHHHHHVADRQRRHHHSHREHAHHPEHAHHREHAYHQEHAHHRHHGHYEHQRDQASRHDHGHHHAHHHVYRPRTVSTASAHAAVLPSPPLSAPMSPASIPPHHPAPALAHPHAAQSAGAWPAAHPPALTSPPAFAPPPAPRHVSPSAPALPSPLSPVPMQSTTARRVSPRAVRASPPRAHPYQRSARPVVPIEPVLPAVQPVAAHPCPCAECLASVPRRPVAEARPDRASKMSMAFLLS
ncbi:hypothetical protein AMAG_06529 [Allomyces macrogynus ATCC 38327]|uniref:Gti1/Pac2 family protein n=1 Tax=Allomyces macrogynus (strain ATCC 38327) TaxID=578462 RepID=A0A0L0SH01_ALLM3|nr:hypothetical protein AMAG_06529 [Allomyces macrogynus ATCC 38327]|eukprot:KNE61727.1 hypothetical protein AMAG_06529 [Allomyces macrogynus ATCC 38327]